ncbi:atp4 subunit B of the stator stalk of mitochondrial F1F0 ATP synthase [Friedmanniomyces endolithicus]|uniref:ATP synthase subunit 4 n=1 Tax=Friedmanniomyces endolithicus TaxID=329885 RepID=A0AAN6FDY9_9PEZI|nr:atp4 subunit B of the stator stalk of mitochondrial F1F0 ATP synthase [Friedmanniomyces endolithicus]KAK0290784.1 atp4 subunit B of the stator stalk of mitochondrial F1F0 ATP synthase [Friedmanniomyces endolithicus]KAK0314177.1 atp4 subunit B of the stator stalk of mitochondrial F1F0 ATP synthase [Friedmanniomyces endolithicus]KAK0997875.1 atp4 subunit B of the stator stalk of mitochondrial F1F0 ATP synthase [Friedmanniomyces endolithicus]
MASLLAKCAMGAIRSTRPTLLRTTLPAATAFTTSSPKLADSTPQPPSVPSKDPKDTAQSILNALPGNSLVSKTAILSAGAGLSIAAISNEIYVVNEESIVALSLLTIYWAVYNYAGPMYKEWADATADKYAGILNAARKDHTDAVKKRIENVKDLSGVIDITKDLFAVSKETANLEAQAYELEQRTAVVTEARTVLDSWVRYEGQVKTRQQRELAESIIAKIGKELENPRVLDQILKQSVADVERIVAQKA